MSEKVLIVDDDEHMRFFLEEAVKKRGYESDAVGDAESAIDAVRQRRYSLVLLDIRLPGMSGIEAIPRIREQDPNAVVIVMTAYGSKDLALDAMRAGAYDYFTKPFKMDEMSVVISRALEKRGLQQDVKKLEAKLRRQYSFDDIVGTSSAMQQVYELIQKVVETDVTVLICGESGTGKELIAQAIHDHSARKDDPFVKLNCVAIPEGLLESELFGHEKGSFTGAVQRKSGKFELANEGTIFLDEIGDMSLATQAKILRVLQEKEFELVGGTETIGIDVRVIAATNKDLARAVEEARFREDLYFRLNVFSIVVPPLRERKEDIPLLVDNFLYHANEEMGRAVDGVSSEVMDLLQMYHWPGNVRELENCVHRAVVMADEDIITPRCLPLHLQSIAEDPKYTLPDKVDSLDDTLDDVEKQIIVDTLHQTGGVQSKAARLLGVSERSLWHRVKKLEIDVGRIKAG
ncbi:MAG: sigma-54 dependent transcriptional regulator [Planctomycetota bacterium]